MTSPLKQTFEELFAANRILAGEGVIDGFGHVSVRNPTQPDHYFMTRSNAGGPVDEAGVVELDAPRRAQSALGLLAEEAHVTVAGIVRKLPQAEEQLGVARTAACSRPASQRRNRAAVNDVFTTIDRSCPL